MSFAQPLFHRKHLAVLLFFWPSTYRSSQSLLPHTTKPLPRLIFRPVIPLYGQWYQILSNDINMREKRDRPTPVTPLSLSRLHLRNQWKGEARIHPLMKLEYLSFSALL